MVRLPLLLSPARGGNLMRYWFHSINWRYLPVLLLRLALLAVAGSLFPAALYLWAVGLV